MAGNGHDTSPTRFDGVTAIDMIPRPAPLSYLEQQEQLQKAVRSKDAPQGEAYKTRTNPYLHHVREISGIKDPAKRMMKQYQTLRSAAMTWMWKKYESTRVYQCMPYWSEPRYPGDPGFRVVLTNRNASPSRAQRKRAKELQRLLSVGGKERERPGDLRKAPWDATWTRKADALPVTMTKWLRNYLPYGHAAIEIEASPNDPVAWFKTMDATTVRMVYQQEEGVDPEKQAPPYLPVIRPNLERPEYVVVDQTGAVAREYGYGELLFSIKNPISDEFSEGYGFSDLELVIELLLAEVMGIRYNREGFVDNNIPAGAAVLAGFSTETKEEFEAIVKDNVGGGPGKWFRMPMLMADDPQAKLEWVNFSNGVERQDMMWQNYIQFVVGCFSATLGIAPEEMGFTSIGGNSGTLNNPDPASRITQGRDKGLIPLLEAGEQTLTELVQLEEPSGDFEVRLSGMHPRDAMQESQLRQQRLDTYTTVDEERARDDMPPRRIPINVKKWRTVNRVLNDGWREKVDSDELEEAKLDIYYQLGGEFSLVDKLPTNLTQQQIVTQEMGDELSPEMDPADQFQQQMDAGPPPQWSERVDMNAWKADKEKQAMAQGQPEPGADDLQQQVPMQKGSGRGYRVFEVERA